MFNDYSVLKLAKARQRELQASERAPRVAPSKLRCSWRRAILAVLSLLNPARSAGMQSWRRESAPTRSARLENEALDPWKDLCQLDLIRPNEPEEGIAYVPRSDQVSGGGTYALHDVGLPE